MKSTKQKGTTLFGGVAIAAMMVCSCGSSDRGVSQAGGSGGEAGGGGSGALSGAGGSGAEAGIGGGATGGTGGACTPPVPSGTCDTFPQCGCTGSYACDVNDNSTGATECIPISKNLGRGESCVQHGDCEAGLSCAGGLTCQQFCEQNADCATVSATSKCLQVKGIKGYFVCTDQCSLYSPAPVCGSGMTCANLSQPGDSPPGLSQCRSTQGTSTTTCSANEDCAPGYICASDSCHHWCRQGQDSDCQSPETCYPASGSDYVFVGNEAFGFCCSAAEGC